MLALRPQVVPFDLSAQPMEDDCPGPRKYASGLHSGSYSANARDIHIDGSHGSLVLWFTGSYKKVYRRNPLTKGSWRDCCFRNS